MLCGEMGRFVFEARPDLFPQGYLTDTETELWGLYYTERSERSEAIRNKHGG